MSRITQKGATGGLSLVANGAFQTSTDSALDTLVGTRWDLSDGREVMLVKAGGTALDAGKIMQDAAIVADHQNIAVAGYTAYSNNGNQPAQITVTLGGTAATANQYRGGFVVVNDGTGEGQTVRIASHPAADASASLVITLEEGFVTAPVAAASEVCLLPPHGKDIVVMPTTATGAVAGITLYPIAASAYGYVVTKGVTSCLAQGAIGVGLGFTHSATTAGAALVAAATTARHGYAAQAGVDTEYRAVYVNV